jgi:PIN domain nuclease of toxin-antitoxin system
MTGILDSSALVDGAGASTVNLAEIVSILVRNGVTAALADDFFTAFPLTVYNLDLDTAIAAGAMIHITSSSHYDVLRRSAPRVMAGKGPL